MVEVHVGKIDSMAESSLGVPKEAFVIDGNLRGKFVEFKRLKRDEYRT